MSRRAWGAAVAGVLLLASSGPLRADDPVVARSGSITLTATDVRRMIESSDPQTRERLAADPSLLSQFVRLRVARLAVEAEAKAKKWDQKPEVAARMEQARNDALVESYLESVSRPDPSFPSDAEIAAAYQANQSRFVTPRQYRLAQIYIAVPPGAAKDVAEKAQKRARELYQQLAAGKTDFADLARKQSDDKASAAKGGELDWLPENQLLPQIRDLVAGLQKDAVGEPVQAAEGWHIIKLLDTRPAGIAPLADVREQIIAMLREQKTQQNARAFLAELQRRTPVQIDEIGLAKLSPK